MTPISWFSQFKRGTRAARLQAALNNIEFGACELLDGLIRVCSLGILETDLLPMQYRRASRRFLKSLK